MGSVAAHGQAVGEAPIDTALMELPDETELPMVTPYYFVHQYLSVVAPMIQDRFILENVGVLNYYSALGNGFRSPFSDSDITVTPVDIDGKTIYVWKFPEPAFEREALYVAFFPFEDGYKSFAISIGRMVDWEISTSTELLRATFGRVKRPDSAEECVRILIERGAPGKIDPGEFLQENYDPPKQRY